MKIVCISDTHSLHRNMHNDLPDGDFLVHAGDITDSGNLSSVIDFNSWLGELPHKHKIIIAGNHDFCAEQQPETFERAITNALYLKDASCTIDGVKFYGSPWQPWFYDWAFNFPRNDVYGAVARATWRNIPADIDVLITHGPMRGLRDEVAIPSGDRVGCPYLLERLAALPNLKLHVFGHIHEGYGVTHQEGLAFVNASICDRKYIPCHKPIVIELEEKR